MDSVYILAGVVITAFLSVVDFILNFRENWGKLTGQDSQVFGEDDRQLMTTLHNDVLQMKEIVHDKGGNGAFLVHKDPHVHRILSALQLELVRLSAIVTRDSPYIGRRSSPKLND